MLTESTVVNIDDASKNTANRFQSKICHIQILKPLTSLTIRSSNHNWIPKHLMTSIIKSLSPCEIVINDDTDKYIPYSDRKQV